MFGHVRGLWVAGALLWVVTGCGSEETGVVATLGGTPDGFDEEVTLGDAVLGADAAAGVDSGGAGEDATVDAAIAPDGSLDTGPDAAPDATPDADPDAGTPGDIGASEDIPIAQDAAPPEADAEIATDDGFLDAGATDDGGAGDVIAQGDAPIETGGADANGPDGAPPADASQDAAPPGPPVCAQTGDCGGGVCNPATHLCVACLAAGDCAPAELCLSNVCVASAGCKSDKDCKATNQVCDLAAGACADCNVDADCGSGQKCLDKLCAATPPCQSSKDCPKVCDLSKGWCVECVASADCPAGSFCAAAQTCTPVLCAGPACQGSVAFACKPDGSGYEAGVSCDDAVACTVDGCEVGKGCTHAATDAKCDDANLCTLDTCDAMKGCASTPLDGTICDDGNLCTQGDACSKGVCAPGQAKDCEDGNPCTVDACDPLNGTCGHAAKPCDDGNGCTVDTCDPKSGACSFSWKPSCAAQLPPCSTTVDCLSGVCNVAAHACVQCLTSASCPSGQLCQMQHCVTAPTCTSDTQCKPTKQVCDKAAGLCVDCNVDADCAAGSKCLDHACVAAPACTSSKQCPKVCDVAKGYCVECAVSADCATGSFCTSLGTCAPVVCAGTACVGATSFACKSDGSGFKAASPCNDGNGCTDDGCVGGQGCVFTANASACDDGDVCTKADLCDKGACKGGSPVPCDDQNGCTTDSCDKLNGCVHAPNTIACDDGNPCTANDACAGGQCAGAPKSCDDGKVCTSDACNPAQGCVSTLLTGACSDGSACTTGETCQSGACIGGIAVSCEDANPCTDDSCDPASGCKHLPNTLICDDKSACTVGDTCANAACVGTPIGCDDGNSCTTDSCDPATGCKHAPNSLPCKVGGACGTCSASACVAAGPPTWEVILGGAQDDRFRAAAIVGDSTYVGGLTHSETAGGSDGWVARLDVEGKAVWSNKLGAKNDDAFLALSATVEGVDVAGYTNTSPGVPDSAADGVWFARFDAAGNLLWDKNYLSGGRALSLVAATGGGFVLGGYTKSGNLQQALLLRIDSNGNQVGANFIQGCTEASSLRALSNGGYAFAGATSGTNSFTLVTVDANLMQTGLKTFSTNNVAWALTNTADGNLALAGLYRVTSNPPAWDGQVLKTALNGTAVWNSVLFSNSNAGFHSIALLADGGFMVAGHRDGDGVNGWVARLDASGNKVWDKSFGEVGKFDDFFAIATTTTGWVAAGSTSSNNAAKADGWVVRGDLAGNVTCTCETLAKPTCDDANPCTADLCSDTDGTCSHTKLQASSPCGPSAVCNLAGACIATGCGNGICDPGEKDCKEDCAGQDGCTPTKSDDACDGCSCEKCVCELGVPGVFQADPYCCNNSWDAKCALECRACGKCN